MNIFFFSIWLGLSLGVIKALISQYEKLALTRLIQDAKINATSDEKLNQIKNKTSDFIYYEIYPKIKDNDIV
jgi:uncharacterized protein YjaG (DUF416 family)